MAKFDTETKKIDEIVNKFIDEINNSHSIAEKSKAYDKFRSDLLQNSLGLVHCLLNEAFLTDVIETGIIIDEDFIGSEFDDEVFKKKKVFIKRFKELRRSFVKKEPSNRVQSHLVEAIKCFLYGFDQAAIALCRATLEYALRDRMQKIDDDRISISGLIKEARRAGFISTPEMEKKVWYIKDRANEVMHFRPYRFSTLEIINNTRIVLEDILRPRNPQRLAVKNI